MLPILCMCEFVYTLWCLCVSMLTNRYHNDLILNAPRGVVRVSVTNYKLKSQFSSTILIPIFFRESFPTVFMFTIFEHTLPITALFVAACLIFLLLSLVSFHCFFLQFGFAGLNTEGNFPLKSQFCIANSV